MNGTQALEISFTIRRVIGYVGLGAGRPGLLAHGLIILEFSQVDPCEETEGNGRCYTLISGFGFAMYIKSQ